MRKKYLLAKRRKCILFLRRCNCFHFDTFVMCADCESREKGGDGKQGMKWESERVLMRRRIKKIQKRSAPKMG